MAGFITDGTSVLPPVKTDARGPTGANDEWASGDANKIRQALLDLRTEALNVQPGFTNPNLASVIATGSTTSRTLADRHSAFADVRDFGAIGDGVHDDTSAIQAAVNASPFVAIYPTGNYYRTTASITIPTIATRILGMGHGAAVGGVFAGYVFDKPTGGSIVEGPFSIENLFITNHDAAGGGIRFWGIVKGFIRGCRIEAGMVGIDVSDNIFSSSVSDCRLLGIAAGIGIRGGGSFTDNDIVGWSEGIRAWAAGSFIAGGRMEVNAIALRLGVDASGGINSLSRSYIGGISMEANDIAIDITSMNACTIQGIGHQGSVNSPSHGSIYGIRIVDASQSSFAGVSMSGNYTNAAWQMRGCSQIALIGCAAANGAGTVGAKAWDIKQNLTGLSFIQTNYDPRGRGAADSIPVATDRITALGISQVNNIDGNILSRNIRGLNVAVGAGNASVAVTFPVSLFPGQAVSASLTPVVQGGGTLAGTYYYTPTLVTEYGESGGVEVSTTITAPNNAATMTFFGGLSPRYMRRLYRGRASGDYDGYYDLPINSDAAFTDTGAAFTGLKNPPYNASSPSGVEDNANYTITVTPQWDTTVWVTNKATTGFTINFGTVAPGGGSFVDWQLIR
jgi:hypothetical protein